MAHKEVTNDFFRNMKTLQDSVLDSQKPVFKKLLQHRLTYYFNEESCKFAYDEIFNKLTINEDNNQKTIARLQLNSVKSNNVNNSNKRDINSIKSPKASKKTLFG